MLTAIDCLLECDFKTERTLVLAVGFDEEGGAEQSYGARCLAEKLMDRYGQNGVELIVCHSAKSIGKFLRLTALLLLVRRRYCGHRASVRDGLCLARNS